MNIQAALRDRLPSALAALGLQAIFFALLAVSFVVVRQIPQQKEMVFYLPPPARPRPAPPVVIDGRKFTPPPSATAPPLFVPPVAPLPDLTKPPAAFAPSLPQSGTHTSDTAGLRPPDHKDAAQELLNPPAKAKDEQHWADELKKKNSPPDVSCAENAAKAPVGAGAPTDKACAVAIVKIGAGAPPPPPPVYYSDLQFKAALAAANARHGVRAAPALTSGPQQEGDHAQAHNDIPGGDAAAGPAGPPFGKAGRR